MSPPIKCELDGIGSLIRTYTQTNGTGPLARVERERERGEFDWKRRKFASGRLRGVVPKVKVRERSRFTLHLLAISFRGSLVYSDDKQRGSFATHTHQISCGNSQESCGNIAFCTVSSLSLSLSSGSNEAQKKSEKDKKGCVWQCFVSKKRKSEWNRFGCAICSLSIFPMTYSLSLPLFCVFL